MGFFMQGVMGSGAAKTQSESSIFSVRTVLNLMHVFIDIAGRPRMPYAMCISSILLCCWQTMKQVIFGLLGDKLPAQSFSQNNQAQGAWTSFL